MRHDPEHKASKKLYKVLRKLERKLKNADEAWEAQNWEEAASGYKNALKEDAEHKVFGVRLNLKVCEAYNHINKGAEAIPACNRVLEIEPKNVEALIARHEAKKLEEDFQGSLQDIQEAGRHRENDRAINQKIHEAQAVLEQSKKKNYYKILGVKRNASDREIKKAYRKLALTHHPDKIKSEKDEDKKKAEVIFRDIAEAYGILSDKELRGKYDRGEDVTGQAQQQGQQHFHGFPGGFPGGFGGGQQFHFNFRL